MKYSRREFMKTTGLGSASLAFPVLLSSCRTSAKRPNILFIMSDDHAEQAISCYGKKLIDTPNIDRIANEGVRFVNSFVTNSLCAPSRATMLTGKYSNMNGLRDNRDEFDGSQMTFPKLLQEAGYRTSIFGKWHLKTKPTGFDDWQVLIGQGQYYNPEFLENGQKRQITGYTTDIITDKAIAGLKKRDPEKPFCMLVHHKAPHRNWMPNIKHLGAFDDVEIPLPETFYDDYAGREPAAHADMRIDKMYLTHDMKLRKGFYKKETGSGGNINFSAKAAEGWEKKRARLTEEQRTAWDAYYDKINQDYKNANLQGDDLLRWKYQRYMKDYLSCILSVDENIGRLLDYLDESGLAENTIVIYTSDQGFYLGEHGWYDKRFMYEESLGMPLLMRFPAEIKAGQVCNDMVLNLDFAPTFLDYAGVDVPVEMQGESMRRVAQGSTPASWRKEMYYHYYEYPHGWHRVRKHYGIRTERYKLIHFYEEPESWELYDLQEDIHEIHNLIDDPAYAEVIAKLKTELVKLKKKYKDTRV